MEFVIEERIDDSGTATYVAYRAEDFDEEGIPLPTAIYAEGETPLLAIASLCYKLEEVKESKDENS